MVCNYWFVWSSQICCYYQTENFEIFKFKSFNHLSVFYSTMFLLLLVQHGNIEINRGARKSNQNISHVVIGMLTVY